MKQIKLLLIASLLTSCTTSQLVYQTQEEIELERAKKLESLGLKEYTVITKDSTFIVQIPIDSTMSYSYVVKHIIGEYPRALNTTENKYD